MCRPRMLSHVISIPFIALHSTHTALQLPQSPLFPCRRNISFPANSYPLKRWKFHISIHKYIDLLSTLHRSYIDPTPTLLSTSFNTASWIVKLPPPPHFYCFSSTTTPPPPPPHFYCFPSTTTTTTTTATTFLLFSLHLVVVEGKQSGVDCLRQLW